MQRAGTSHAPIVVEQVDLERVLDLRGSVLRPGQARETLPSSLDRSSESIHVGALEGRTAGDPASGRVIAISTIGPEAAPEIVDRTGADGAWRVRGVASDPARRGAGAGRLVVEACTTAAWQAGAPLIWCNARIGALGFYRLLGWAEHGDVFEVEGIGPHVVMSIAPGDGPGDPDVPRHAGGG